MILLHKPELMNTAASFARVVTATLCTVVIFYQTLASISQRGEHPAIFILRFFSSFVATVAIKSHWKNEALQKQQHEDYWQYGESKDRKSTQGKSTHRSSKMLPLTTIHMSAVASEEIRGILSDLSTAPRLCLAAGTMTWRDSYVQLCSALRAVKPYTSNYGPISFVWWIVFEPMYHTRALLDASIEYELRSTEYLALALVFIAFVFITHFANTLAHRYFAHRCFQTSRGVTLVMACFSSLGTELMWWSSIHRRHHKHSDDDGDPHSPVRKGFIYAYVGWMADRENFRTRLEFIGDWVRQSPELLVLDFVAPFVVDLGIFPLLLHPIEVLISLGLYHTGTSLRFIQGMSEVGFFVLAAQLGQSCAVHMSLLFNAYAHEEEQPSARRSCEKLIEPTRKKSGRHLCAARDHHSRLFAILSSGESYHACHHDFPRLAQNSKRWYEDWVFGCFVGLEKIGLIRDVKRLHQGTERGLKIE